MVVLVNFCTCYLLFLYYARLTCWSNLPWTLLNSNLLCEKKTHALIAECD